MGEREDERGEARRCEGGERRREGGRADGGEGRDTCRGRCAFCSACGSVPDGELSAEGAGGQLEGPCGVSGGEGLPDDPDDTLDASHEVLAALSTCTSEHEGLGVGKRRR